MGSGLIVYQCYFHKHINYDHILESCLVAFIPHAGLPSSVRAIARSIVALEGQSVNLRCIPKPFTAALRWTVGGRSLSSVELDYKLGRLNQTLTINNLTMENSGEYFCHVVSADDVTATIHLIVKKGTIYL